MRKSKFRVCLHVEAMEPRALLSTLAPGSSVPVRNAVVADVRTGVFDVGGINDVKIKNDTGLILDVKATFKDNGIVKASFARKIEIGNTFPFDFNKAFVGFISIEVKKFGASRYSNPFSLNRPANGYYGAEFTVSGGPTIFSVG